MAKSALLGWLLAVTFLTTSFAQYGVGGGGSLTPGATGGSIGAGIGGQASLSILKFDSRALINDLANSAINRLSASISASLPMGDFFDKAIKDVLKQVYQGFACKIPSFRFDLSVSVPTTLSIQLPCKTISFNVANYIQQAVVATLVKGAGVAVADEVERCITDESYARSSAICKFILREHKTLSPVALVGWSYDYTNKSWNDISQEIRENSNLFGTPSVITNGQNPEEMQINVGAGRARGGALISASKSYGYIPLPDGKKQAKDLPEYVKPIYSYRMRNQILRDSLVAGYIKLIEKYKAQLAQIKVMMDGVCNAVYNVPIIAPGGIGGIGAPDLFSSPSPTPVSYGGVVSPSIILGQMFINRMFKLSEIYGENARRHEEEIYKLLSGQLKIEEIIKEITNTKGMTKYVPANPNVLGVSVGRSKGVELLLEEVEDGDSCGSDGSEEPVLARGTGCPCPAVSGMVSSSTSTIQQTIGVSTNFITGQIQTMQTILATVISMEEWGTRKQIHMEMKSSAELIRKVMCTQAQLDYLKIAIQLDQMEISVGQLQAHFSALANEEAKLYKRALEAQKRLGNVR